MARNLMDSGYELVLHNVPVTKPRNWLNAR
jgi:hypothetical protein